MTQWISSHPISIHPPYQSHKTYKTLKSHENPQDSHEPGPCPAMSTQLSRSHSTPYTQPSMLYYYYAILLLVVYHHYQPLLLPATTRGSRSAPPATRLYKALVALPSTAPSVEPKIWRFLCHFRGSFLGRFRDHFYAIYESPFLGTLYTTPIGSVYGLPIWHPLQPWKMGLLRAPCRGPVFVTKIWPIFGWKKVKNMWKKVAQKFAWFDYNG